MKKIFLIIFVLMASNFVEAQDQDVDITYKVTSYSINEVNYDEIALNGDVALSFYMHNDELHFANRWRNNDSQSYGRVYNLETRDIKETKKSYAATEIQFLWEYSNSYDNDSGEANVTIRNIYIDNTILFTAEIVVLKTNRILRLKGYLEY